jgi:hypothetical protein
LLGSLHDGRLNGAYGLTRGSTSSQEFLILTTLILVLIVNLGTG